MIPPLRVYNTLTREKEVFEPLNAPFVGMYVCGPTVYNDVHLGNVRTFLSFDVMYRYLQHQGYKVRYVRNITDVGHLLDESGEGEDKISRAARLEQLEPMEVVQRYTNRFHEVLSLFNFLPPSIEPTATGHILEQIKLTKALIEKGLAYEVDGSVYFDVNKYNQDHTYGKLSGRNVEELIAGQRELEGQAEKRNSIDFALWKKASPEHIMRWDSPWGPGFPGWHLECTVMSTKYLGERFDIHGGGMDLKFPHHDCEIAQSVGGYGQEPAKYWLHTNMVTINGQKMSKSLGNSILPSELISGKHPLLDQAYSPMIIRFFMLQSHYSSTLDFSNEALKAAQKGYIKLMNGLRIAKELEFTGDSDSKVNEKAQKQVEGLCDNCYRAMNDDFNTAQTIAHLFNLLKKINSIQTGALSPAELGEETFGRMLKTFLSFTEEVLGLKEENRVQPEALIGALLDIYKEAKTSKDYDKVDQIRSSLRNSGIVVKDMKDGIDWAYEE
ncbi:cysteine--tRNA ligase [Nafulsella turpanensis]|uniref:cysteine--tRNA ligase n=1 Tax=Nafulsella turpanensis TaxID=1265690 RepID=UPI00034C2260|nr:cysteine--tRNA ligase [Nafulsella turpanensis]